MRTRATSYVTLPSELRVRAQALNSRGQGLALAPNGKQVFVEGLLPGEEALVAIQEEKRNYARAVLLELLSPAEQRREAPCPYYQDCGGCNLQHLDYGAQLEWKHKQLRYCLHSIARYSEEELDQAQMAPATLASSQEFRYRSKSQMPLRCSGLQEAQIGFYRQGSQELVDACNCLIQDEAADQAREAFRESWQNWRQLLPTEALEQGFWRHLLVRISQDQRQALVTLVLRRPKDYAIAPLKSFLRQFQQALRQKLALANCRLAGLYLNFHPEQTNRIASWDFMDLGPQLSPSESELSWDQSCRSDLSQDSPFEERVNRIRYPLGPASFFQINVPQTAQIYSQIRHWVQELGASVVYDLYCGAGSISLQLAGPSCQVHGIEVVEEAVVMAREAARLNGLEDYCHFAVGAAERVLPKLVDAGLWPHPDCLVLDPPRRGLDTELCQFLATELRPPKLIYLSCDPASLARDLALLRDRGNYKLERFLSYDIFPQTMHVETLVLMSRRE